MFKVFYVSGAATVIGLVVAATYGGASALALTAIVSVLEITLSFENAIVNASVLRKMDKVWQARFLTWGIIIAVFGMRLVFPIALVAVMVHLNPMEVLKLALEQPLEYGKYLHSAHNTIAAFGGMFLLMVFLTFLFDHKRQIHWLGIVERKIAQVGNIDAIGVVVAILILLVVQNAVPEAEKAGIMIAGLAGISIFVIIHGAANYMNNIMLSQTAKAIKHGGLASFIYLEFLDASFSFDGVIGAFAITKDIVIITLGLAIGAFFVRSITIFLVQKGTLQKYIFLEHGAYYALGILATLMLLGIYYPIPEMLIGCIGAIVISLAFITSLKAIKTKYKMH